MKKIYSNYIILFSFRTRKPRQRQKFFRSGNLKVRSENIVIDFKYSE
jgi:hypothetical protein